MAWRAQYSGFLLMSLVALLWGGNHVVIRSGHDDLNLVALVFWRWLITFLLLLPWCWRDVRRSWPVLRQHAGRFLLLSLLSAVLFSFAIIGAPFYTAAVNVGMLQATTPVWILLFSLFMVRQSVAPLQAAGIMVGLLGAFIIITHGELATLKNLKFNFGDILALVAAWLWAIYTMILASAAASIRPLTLLFIISGVGQLFLLPIYLFTVSLGGAWFANSSVLENLAPVWSILYVAVGATLIGNLCYNLGVDHLGPAKAGVMLYLAPGVAAFLGFLFLGERLELFHLLGLGLVILGIYLANRQRNFKSNANSPR